MSDTSASAANHITRGQGTQRRAPVLPTQTSRPVSGDRLVPQLISDQATQHPGSTALVDDSMRLTYGEFEARSNALADQLQALGLGANVVAAVCVRRSALMAVAALAVLKAGGAYLPIDSNCPRERLSFILADANVPIVLSDSTLVDQLPKGSWRLLLVDREAAAEITETVRRPIRISPDDLAYVIYTSGSTGKPKGVEITHRNLLNLVFWHQKAYALTADDETAQFTSFGFDAAVADLWPNLAAGAAVHIIIPDEVRSSPELLKAWLDNQEITIAFVPTAVAERLIALDWPATARLRFLLTGADTLHHYPRPGLPFVLVNEYGPTETTVVATAGPVPSEKADSKQQRPTIGRPIDGTEIYIVDDALNPVPRGEVGELCIGGAGVGRGYVNSPELTAKKFVPDPFVRRPGARLYRTGDLARWLPNGEIDFLGRTDNLIKIRGYRIEPNEIVSVLNTCPGVEASAVIARADAAGNLKLLAYLVIGKSQTPPGAGQLRDLLRARLPDYMVPAVFLEIPELPLNANGKLDREALPVPENSKMLRDDDFAEPQTVLEEKLSAVVAELLGGGPVGINDNFFLIGGHSLFGTQLIARIRDTFGVELSLRNVFESPTPVQLARQIENLMVTKIEAMTEDEVRSALEQAQAQSGADSR